jgi:hypothetical protein
MKKTLTLIALTASLTAAAQYSPADSALQAQIWQMQEFHIERTHATKMIGMGIFVAGASMLINHITNRPVITPANSAMVGPGGLLVVVGVVKYSRARY